MTTTFFQKNTLNDANLEREIDQKNNVIHNVIHDVITQLQQVKAALKQNHHSNNKTYTFNGEYLNKE